MDDEGRRPAAHRWDPDAKRWVSEEDPGPVQPEPETTAETPSLPAVIANEPAPPLGPVPRAPVPDGPPAWLAAVVAGAVGGALAVVVMLFFPGTADPRDTVPGTPPAVVGEGADPTDLVSGARPSVVSVAGEDGRSGTGVILDDDATVVTAAATVDGVQNPTITLASGGTLPAQVLGVDVHTRLAILEVDAEGLVPIPRGSADFVRAGEPVVSVASPQGTYTRTARGSVSGVAAPVDGGDGRPLLDAISVEFAGRPPAGSLLVGIDGSPVGITTGAGAGTQTIPIDVVWSVHDQVVAGQPVDHPYIGLVVTELPTDPRLPPDTMGLVVAAVLDGSPAAEAGIRRGEVIVGVAGGPVEGGLTLLARLHEVVDEIEVAVLRDGEVEVVAVAVQRQVAQT